MEKYEQYDIILPPLMGTYNKKEYEAIQEKWVRKYCVQEFGKQPEEIEFDYGLLETVKVKI
jgi:hypothetical protein